jgi:hypothetical protein
VARHHGGSLGRRTAPAAPGSRSAVVLVRGLGWGCRPSFGGRFRWRLRRGGGRIGILVRCRWTTWPPHSTRDSAPDNDVLAAHLRPAYVASIVPVPNRRARQGSGFPPGVCPGLATQRWRYPMSLCRAAAGSVSSLGRVGARRQQSIASARRDRLSRKGERPRWLNPRPGPTRHLRRQPRPAPRQRPP